MDTIGRRDKIDLPEFGLFDIEAKVDTGAYGCALHCHRIQVELKDGLEILSFQVLDPTHPESKDKIFYSEQFSDKSVKNSGGIVEHRYVITTEVLIFGQKFSVDFSLTDRSFMKYPILLGRKFLSRRFLVDVQQKDLSHKQKHDLK